MSLYNNYTRFNKIRIIYLLWYQKMDPSTHSQEPSLDVRIWRL